ncbi:hypothetical protein Dpo_22c00010 [Desulfotignum phosphitoxidans DSM 13687]|uniref:Uncharacterized protein n=1 Tax=Desulfotignum phosphitoxidans DSM 13687 TaxID=1286635 RepID=S0FZ30_9BACT|nr:hypothetical protein Dpo_22c00010 [Desulfotignum phosphitoxidans DSM 13687]
MVQKYHTDFFLSAKYDDTNKHRDLHNFHMNSILTISKFNSFLF